MVHLTQYQINSPKIVDTSLVSVTPNIVFFLMLGFTAAHKIF